MSKTSLFLRKTHCGIEKYGTSQFCKSLDLSNKTVVMKYFCPICFATTEQINLWDGDIYCVDCLRKNYPVIYHNGMTNGTLCPTKPNWQFQGRWFLPRSELFYEYFSNPKNGLAIAFIVASLFTLCFIFIPKEDLNINSVTWKLTVAILVWLFSFGFGLSWFTFINLGFWIRGKESLFGSAWCPFSPLISVKQGIATITYFKYAFFRTIINVQFQVSARFKMLTDDGSNIITGLDKESFFLDVTDVYEHLKKIPGQYFACDNITNRFYLSVRCACPTHFI